MNVQEQDDMAYITAHLPTHGEYGLEIYANEPMKEGDTFTHVCQYLCTWLEKDFRAQYGQVYDRADLSFLNHTLPLSYAGRCTESADTISSQSDSSEWLTGY